MKTEDIRRRLLLIQNMLLDAQGAPSPNPIEPDALERAEQMVAELGHDVDLCEYARMPSVWPGDVRENLETLREVEGFMRSFSEASRIDLSFDLRAGKWALVRHLDGKHFAGSGSNLLDTLSAANSHATEEDEEEQFKTWEAKMIKAKKRALSRYPAAADKDSPLGRKISEVFHRLKAAGSKLLNSPNSPLLVTEVAAKELGILPLLKK